MIAVRLAPAKPQVPDTEGITRNKAFWDVSLMGSWQRRAPSMNKSVLGHGSPVAEVRSGKLSGQVGKTCEGQEIKIIGE